WYAIVPENEVINLSISVEDAFKVIVSGGIVSPDSLVSLPRNSKSDRKLETLLEPQPLQRLQVEEEEPTS
ncbi:MAG: hypothetical protein F6K32_22435, partial [Desertifilum sp. SIO1I2]|nr:hypothetical protein [Desertifilum sp. SIO1I2]